MTRPDSPVFDNDPLDAHDADGSTTPSDIGSLPAQVYDQVLAELADDVVMPHPNAVVTSVTRSYLAQLEPEHAPRPSTVEKQLLGIINGVYRVENQKAHSAPEKIPPVRTLTHWQIAQILLKLHRVIRIAPSGKDTDREYDLLAMYQDEGPARGTYTASEDEIRLTARRYNAQLTLKEFDEVVAVLREDSPRREQNSLRDIIAARNGIVYYGTQPADITIYGTRFHFEPKGLHSFHPAIVLLTKNDVDYVVDAPPQVITHPEDGDWEVTAWLEDLFDTPGDEGLADLIWEIIGAIIRPHVRWGKTAWFYSEVGNNGKGTLCALMRNLIGHQAHTSIPLADFSKDFALEPLVRANAIIVDENDVGAYIDKAANLKAIVTNDVIQINRKHRVPIAYQFWGFMIQCLNEFPRVKDKSDSFYRRQLFVPFTKSFTDVERKYIKDDYLQRREVLEYVFWYAINRAGAHTPGEYYELSEPAATREVLAEYKETNDPVRAFWRDFRDRLTWSLVPFTFGYDLYKAWHADVSPSGSPVSHPQFVSDLIQIIRQDPEWHCPDKNRKIRPGTHMDHPEPLIVEYDLKKWKNPHYAGTDVDRIAKPVLQANYRGLLRGTVPANGISLPPDIAAESSELQDPTRL